VLQFLSNFLVWRFCKIILWIHFLFEVCLSVQWFQLFNSCKIRGIIPYVYKAFMPVIFYLTGDEQKLFSRIGSSLREECNVVPETGKFKDTPEARAMRFRLTRVHDPELKNAVSKFSDIRTEDEFNQALQGVDLGKINERDFIQLAFAIGPDGIGLILTEVLNNAKNEDHMILAASLSELRHELLESLSASPSSA